MSAFPPKTQVSLLSAPSISAATASSFPECAAGPPSAFPESVFGTSC